MTIRKLYGFLARHVWINSVCVYELCIWNINIAYPLKQAKVAIARFDGGKCDMLK